MNTTAADLCSQPHQVVVTINGVATKFKSPNRAIASDIIVKHIDDFRHADPMWILQDFDRPAVDAKVINLQLTRGENETASVNAGPFEDDGTPFELIEERMDHTDIVSKAIGEILTVPVCLEVIRDVITDIQLGTDADLMKTQLLPGITAQEMHDTPSFFIYPQCISMLMYTGLETLLAGLLRHNNIPDVVHGTPVTDMMEPFVESRINEILPILIQEETEKFTAAGHTFDADAVNALHEQYTKSLMVDALMEQLGVNPDVLEQLKASINIQPE